MLGIKDGRTAGDQTKQIKRVSLDIPYYSIVWYDGEQRMSYPLSNDPVEAKELFAVAVKDGVFIDEGPEAMVWVNVRMFQYAYLKKFNPSGE